jgi:hypothetical protein
MSKPPAVRRKEAAGPFFSFESAGVEPDIV